MNKREPSPLITTPGRNRSASAADLKPKYIDPNRLIAFTLPSIINGKRVMPRSVK